MKQTFYTALDIERYHSCNMSAAEMNALEKAALDDPMLADALEGYSFTPTPVADISLLKQKLKSRIEETENRRGILFISNTWMRVAALFILFAGGGWLVFQTFSDKNPNDIAQQKTPSNAVEPPSNNMTVNDSTKFLSPQMQQMESAQEDVVSNQSSRSQVPKSSLPLTEAPAKNSMTEVYDFRVTTDSFSNNAVATNRSAIPQNRPETFGRSRSTTLEEKEAAFLKSLPVSEAEKKNDTIKDLNIVLQPADISLNEVVVKKREQSPGTESKMKLKMTADTVQNTEDFDDYIASNMRKPEQLRQDKKAGEVELSFDTNKKGEAINIAVVKSLCEKCDEEAIRLLKEGPKWKKNKKKEKVKIKF